MTVPPPEMWPQPLAPLGSLTVSAIVAAVPLAVLLLIMGGLRKSGLIAAAWALGVTVLVAATMWRMPVRLLGISAVYGAAYAVYPILYIVFAALCLYNLTRATGAFELLRRWMLAHASGDAAIQAVLVAFCFGGLLEACTGFGAPVAVTAFLLTGLGLTPFRAVFAALVANTAPVAFGGMGIPIVALAGVTGLDLSSLSAMVGRQVPLLSLIIPSYLAWVVDGRDALRRVWPATVTAGVTFAAAQGLVANLWGPYAADVIASLVSISAVVVLLRVWSPADAAKVSAAVAVVKPADALHGEAARSLTRRETLVAWGPWVLLALAIVGWSYFGVIGMGARTVAVPGLNRAIWITLYGRPYTATYNLQPFATATAVLLVTIAISGIFGAAPRTLASAAASSLRQLRIPGLTVVLIVALAYVYNYSGMVYTLGAAAARIGPAFPVASAYLGWLGCFLSGSDTASNLLFGNLQVAAAHQLGISPVLLAATNSSAGAVGKMISPQNIAVGVTTVGLVGQEGRLLRATFWHSVILAGLIGLLAWLQAYQLAWMIPGG